MSKYYDSNCNVIWKDRKRYFGLPISFSRYSIVENPGKWIKLYSHIGLFSTQAEETYFYRIDDMNVYQSLFDKMFNVGTITVFCGNESNDVMVLQKVKNPYKVRTLLTELVEKERAKRGMRYSEFQA